MKFGEMERDALVAHGIWSFIKESYIERCDKFIIQVSVKSGDISIANPEIGLFYDNVADGVVSYHLVEGVGSKGLTPDRILGLNLYDQKARIIFGWRLRETIKFEGLDPLLVQMKKDCDQARELTSNG